MTTLAPSSASRSTHAAPIPLAPPVTSATLPATRPIAFIPAVALGVVLHFDGEPPTLSRRHARKPHLADEIVLYRSVASRAFTAVWMLEELGLAWRSEMVDIRAGAQKSSAYLKLNPMGKVPTLLAGKKVVSENPAICIFLADRYGYGTLAPRIEHPDRGAWLK